MLRWLKVQRAPGLWMRLAFCFAIALSACKDRAAQAITAASAASASQPSPSASSAPPASPVPAAASAAEKPAVRISDQEAYQQASHGNGFTMGPMMAAHTAYVFFDPACPHCAHLWGEAKPLAGKLKIVWMPVALLRSASVGQGATILSAPHPAEAMEQNEASVLARGNGIAIDPSLPAAMQDKVKANTALFNKLGAESVPLIVFQNARTGQYGTHVGAVNTAELTSMFGL